MIGALLLLSTMAAAPPAAAQTAAPADPHVMVIVGCDAPTGHECSFAVFSGNSDRGPWFIIPAGSRMSLPNIEPGYDHYVVVIDGSPPLSLDCADEKVRGRFCKVAAFVAGYNN
jgi:hypothetical protein